MANLSITGIIDRLEEKMAVIRTEDGQQIIWPIAKMPEGITEGEAIKLSIVTDKKETKEQEKIAKEVLNEILRVNKDD